MSLVVDNAKSADAMTEMTDQNAAQAAITAAGFSNDGLSKLHSHAFAWAVASDTVV